MLRTRWGSYGFSTSFSSKIWFSNACFIWLRSLETYSSISSFFYGLALCYPCGCNLQFGAGPWMAESHLWFILWHRSSRLRSNIFALYESVILGTKRWSANAQRVLRLMLTPSCYWWPTFFCKSWWKASAEAAHIILRPFVAFRENIFCPSNWKWRRKFIFSSVVP